MTESKRKHMVLLLLLMIIPMIILGSINVVSAADRSDVTYDEVLANFRNAKAGRIGRNNLYRSQHPANNTNRSLCANALLEQNKIWTVLNLSDTLTDLYMQMRF